MRVWCDRVVPGQLNAPPPSCWAVRSEPDVLSGCCKTRCDRGAGTVCRAFGWTCAATSQEHGRRARFRQRTLELMHFSRAFRARIRHRPGALPPVRARMCQGRQTVLPARTREACSRRWHGLSRPVRPCGIVGDSGVVCAALPEHYPETTCSHAASEMPRASRFPFFPECVYRCNNSASVALAIDRRPGARPMSPSSIRRPVS